VKDAVLKCLLKVHIFDDFPIYDFGSIIPEMIFPRDIFHSNSC